MNSNFVSVDVVRVREIPFNRLHTSAIREKEVAISSCDAASKRYNKFGQEISSPLNALEEVLSNGTALPTPSAISRPSNTAYSKRRRKSTIRTVV